MSTVKIQVSDLHKSFGSNNVLKGINLDIAEGEVVCVIGPSGSGKSTLLRCLNKLEDITSGKVVVDGFDVTDPKVDINEVRRHVGMVFQHFNLFPHMSVAENIMLAPVELKKMNRTEARAKALELLDRVGLKEKADARPASLSGGQKQRVAIARALAMAPGIMLFDEATSALDNPTQNVVAESTRQMNATRIVIAHRLSTIRDADRIVVLDGGRIVQQGQYDELLADTEGLFARLAKRQI